MNDIYIYKKKAKKYKSKYLELKKQFGGTIPSDLLTEEQPVRQQQIINNINYDFELIGEGSFGCIISPPLQFNENINIKFPESNISLSKEELNNIFTSKDYVGKLLSCDSEVFNQEYQEYLKLNAIDPEAKYRSKLIFAAYMTKEELTDQIEKLKSQEGKLKLKLKLLEEKEDSISIPVLTPLETLYFCLKDKKLLSYYNKPNISKNYGYIISTRVGKSFKDHELGKFNNDQIIKILENLKESIGDLIQKLYNNKSIHGDIKLENMTLDANLKVYFIDFGFMQKYTDLDYSITQNHQYPDILNIFFKIKNSEENKPMNKKKLIELLKNEKYQKDKKYSIQSIILNKTKINYINYSRFFESIDDEEHDLDYFYNKCIGPIAKNSDIYALSVYIYVLFFNFFDDIQPFNYLNSPYKNFYDFFINYLKKKNTINILNVLLINALYNNINGPEELIYYIDKIINSIKHPDDIKSL